MARYSKSNKFRAVMKYKNFKTKFTGIIFIVFSLMIVFFTVMDSEKSKFFKMSLLDLGSHLIYTLSFPLNAISSTVNNVEEVYNVFSKNKKLKNQVSRVEMLQNELLILRHENKVLKEALNIENSLFYKYKTAKVLVGIKSSFIKTLIILAGEKHGVKEGFTVISNTDLLGYIYESGKSTSRVLLITDINSRIPVTVANKNYRLILSGNNSNFLNILELGDFSNVEEGDQLITSGDGGVFPQGIPVGLIFKNSNKRFVVRPNTYARDLDYVRVINWSPEQLAKLPITDVDKLPIFYE